MEEENEMEVNTTLVHAAHCCSKHGCKYGANACPVVERVVQQEQPCDVCEMNDEAAAHVVDFIAAWLEKRIAELEAQWSDRSEPLHVQHAAMQRAHYYRDVVRGLREGAWKS